MVIWLTIQLFTIQACKEPDKQLNIPDYAKDISIVDIKGDSIFNNVFFGRPGSLRIKGDTMLLSDMTEGAVYSLLSLEGDSLICRFGKQGEGPNEYLRPHDIQITEYGNIISFDDVKNIIRIYESLKEMSESTTPTTQLHIEDMTGGFIKQTSNGYVADQLYGDGKMFRFYNQDGSNYSTFGIVPGTNQEGVVKPDFYMAYQVEFAISPDKKRMCAVGSYHDWLAFFDVSGNEPRLIKEYYSTPPIVETKGKGDNFSMHTTPETKLYYLSMAPFRDGIYVNYAGVTDNEIKEGDINNVILKCNWNGQIEKCYVPNLKIWTIAASENGENLYAISTSDAYPENKIFKFEMNKYK